MPAKKKVVRKRKKRNGRPPYKPNDEHRSVVRGAAGFGLTFEEIGSLVGISADTLTKYYRADLDQMVATRNASVARSLYAQATSGNVQAAIFWTKTRMNWRETPQRLEITGLKQMAAELAGEYNLTAEEAIAEAELLIASGRQDD